MMFNRLFMNSENIFHGIQNAVEGARFKRSHQNYCDQ